MSWNWDPASWKKSTKVLLGLATIWPLVYMFLFMGSIFSMFLFLPFAESRTQATCGRLDVLQLDRKITAGEIKDLKIRSDRVIATDRTGSCTYETRVSDETTRRAIANSARELANGRPRVEAIDENTSEPDDPLFIPLGFGVLMIAHLFTMLLIMGLMPLYIILAVKNERLGSNNENSVGGAFMHRRHVADIVYWYLYIWRRPREQEIRATPSQPPAAT